MNPKGYISEGWSRKDYSFERTFSASLSNTERKPLGRKKELDGLNLPPIYQGNYPSCVSATVTFIQQYQEATSTSLSQSWLAEAAGTKPTGAKPSWVLETARLRGIVEVSKRMGSMIVQELNAQQHRLSKYFYVEDPTPEIVYAALRFGCVAVGVLNWQNSGQGHYIALVDVDENGDWIYADWQVEGSQQYGTLSKETKFDEAVLVPNSESPVPSRLGLGGWFVKSLPFYLSSKSVKTGLIALGIATLSFLGILQKNSGDFGSLSLPGKYRTALRQDISASASSVPVSSVTLKTGETLTSSTIQFPVYLTINPNGTTEEDVECYGLTSTTGSASWTSCNTRGLSLLGGATTSTVSGAAYPHAAGESVILATTPYAFNRFVDTFSAQNVTGTKTFTNGRIDLGDNTTTTAKQIFFQVGQTFEPYFKIRGPQAGRTTSTFYFSVDGSSDLELNSSGTTAGASSTRAGELVEGLFGTVASTTLGIGYVSSTGNACCALGIIASSTASLNGGFLNFVTSTAGAGRLFWDVRSFLAGNWSWSATNTFVATSVFSGNVSFSGNVTSTGVFKVQTPTSTLDAANRTFVERWVYQGVATGTTGFAITAGQALYISTTSTLFPTNSSVASSTFQFVGIAEETAASGAEIRYTKPGGINCQQSSLSPGLRYHLNGTSGQVSATSGTMFARIGTAVSATCLQVDSPKYIARGAITISATGNVTTTIGFYPAQIDIRAAIAGLGAQIPGISIGDDSNQCVIYDGGNTGSEGFSSTKAWQLRRSDSASIVNVGTVSDKSPYGFTVNASTASVNATLQYVAYSQ